MCFESPGDDARGALREQVLVRSWTTLGQSTAPAGRIVEKSRSVVMITKWCSFVRRQDLDVWRSRSTDGGPVDSFEPVAR
jgi:hypothetical protein